MRIGRGVERVPTEGVTGKNSDRWGVILAGGDGVRLRSLTRMISGDERPKQFCPIVNGKTLLEVTRQRISRTIAPQRTLEIYTRGHRRFYTPLLGHPPSAQVIIQPQNRGTAPAILYSLLIVAAQAPQAAVAIFPSDHYVSNAEAFMAHVNIAFEAAEANPDSVILLGIEPEGPEVQYGWIEPGEPLLSCDAGTIYGIRRFREKPCLDQANGVFAKGCLWNSFVLVARNPALLRLIATAAPELFRIFSRLQGVAGSCSEAEAAESVYEEISELDFSRDVLAIYPERLAVLPVANVHWNNFGEAAHVISTLNQINDKDFEFAVARSLY